MSDNDLIATIPRTQTEEIQVKISEFKGKKFLDMRIFYTTDNGATWLPTKKGIAVYPDSLETLKSAIETAQKELEAVE